MQNPRFPGLLRAVEEEELLERCDQRIRGEQRAEERPEELGERPAADEQSERARALQAMSEPLDAAFREQMAALLERPAQPALQRPAAQRVGAEKKQARGRWIQAGAGLALAAGLGAIFLPRLLSQRGTSEALPVLALELAERDTALMAAPTPAGGGGLRAHQGGCIELTLRPMHSYEGELETAAVLLSRSSPSQPPVSWPLTIQKTAAGTLRQDGPCVQLPAAVTPGDWQLVIAYGSRLPQPSDLVRLLGAPPAPSRTWATVQQPLQIVH